ncbi:hypothetical protein T484DRAFT_1751923 [Baffinella frigidus]|nr:hypothetical protein T484DRAFT_1751923 [Cryptophyta sp. CCMP2293]
MSHQNVPADEPTAKAHSHPTLRPRRVSFEDAEFSRLSAQSMPAAMSGRNRRHSLSVSWETTIEVCIIPARQRASDADSAKRRVAVEDDARARLSAPPMPASGKTRRHSWPRSVSWDTTVDILIIPARERVTLEATP